jgi:hypothetical protein
MSKKPLEVLRGIAILPGALVCAILFAFPVHWFVMMIRASRNTEFAHSLSDVSPGVLERFGYAFFTPFVMIFVGARIAPRFKLQAGIALAVLCGILFGIALSIAYSRGMLADYGWFRLTITCVLGLSGAALGLYHANKMHEQALLGLLREG